MLAIVLLASLGTSLNELARTPAAVSQYLYGADANHRAPGCSVWGIPTAFGGRAQ